MHLLDDALVIGSAHESLERRQGTRREHVEVRELAGGERDPLEPVEIARPLARPVDEPAAVRADQAIGRSDGHAVTLVGMSPSSSSFAITNAADSSGSMPSVSTTISGDDGAS